MNYTNRLGEITELRCRLDFVKRGIPLSQPTNPACRYDFVADIGGRLIKIQCKTCHLEQNNVIVVTTSSKNWNNGVRRDYIHDIDYFYTNWQNQGYLIPIACCENNPASKSIRLGGSNTYFSNKDSTLYGSEVEIDKVIHDIAPSFDYSVVDIESNAIQCFENRHKEYTCKLCGARTKSRGRMCLLCARKNKTHPDKPSRDELKQMIRTMPFTRIATKYGNSDNAIRKWCISYKLPAKSSVIKRITDDEWASL